MTDKLLIRNGSVVTLDERLGVIADGDVLIVDGRIAAVEPDVVSTDAEVVDASDMIVIPGFIDTHRHLWETVLRGMLPSCSLGEYFVKVMITYAGCFTAEDVYVGDLLGAYEALDAGITTVVDWCNCTTTPEHADAAIAALRETGVRSMFAFGAPGGAGFHDRTRGHPTDARRVRDQYFSSPDQLLTFALALRGPLGVEAEVNRRDFELARDLGARITVHAGMRLPGMEPREIEMLQELNLLGDDTTYVHCNETPDADLDAIASSGGTVSISPHVEMVMGHGLPATGRLLQHGLRPTLSVDVATSSPGDMFTQMRSTLAEDRIRAFNADRETGATLGAEDVLRFATIDGAHACGLEREVGTIAPGKAADIVLIRADQVNMLPMVDPVGSVVTCANPANVDTVLVGGRIVKRGGRLVDVDGERLRTLAYASLERVQDAAAAHTVEG